VCVVQGSVGAGVPQSQGAQAAPAGQAGQLHTGGAVDPELPPPPLPVAEPLLVPVPAGIVVVVVAMAPQAQLQAGQVAPAGQAGQLQVQVPVDAPVPQPPPAEPPVPPAPFEPPVPPVSAPAPLPQSHLQGGQVSPGRQAGQLQLQVPLGVAEPLPVVAGGAEQSQVTLGQLPVEGQATGWTQPQPPPVASRSRQ